MTVYPETRQVTLRLTRNGRRRLDKLLKKHRTLYNGGTGGAPHRLEDSPRVHQLCYLRQARELTLSARTATLVRVRAGG